MLIRSYLLRKQKGQAIVEFVICFILFATLILGMMQFFIILQNRTSLEAASRTAILHASVYRFPDQLSQAEEKATQVLQSMLRRSSFIPSDKINSIRVSINMGEKQTIVGSQFERQFYVIPISLQATYDLDLILPIVRRSVTISSTVHSMSEYIQW